MIWVLSIFLDILPKAVVYYMRFNSTEKALAELDNVMTMSMTICDQFQLGL